MAVKYWLVKSEPSSFSIYDLEKSKNKTTYWDGVRNYQARNFMRDEMRKGDKILFYHSNTDPNAIVGVCEVVKESYADHTQFDPDDKHYFPSSNPENPVWFMVDIKLLNIFKKPVTLADIKNNSNLKNMRLVQKGSRLSVMSVSKQEFNVIVDMSKK